MSVQKIVTYVAALLGVVGLIFQITILGKGDDVIEMAALSGDYGVVSSMVSLAIIIIVIAVILTLAFSVMNLASDPEKLKKAMISIGAFLAVVLIAFLFSSGDETPLKDGEVLSATGSRLVETGLRTFYFLVVIAAGAMIYSGVRRLKN
ncbi:MAG: hypothetical protein PVJ97_04080 [Flavobacteriaceae bacterium]|jgi:hypothetical protein